MPKLIVEDAARTFLVDLEPGASVLIGRSVACHVRIDAERASRRHAEIVATGKGHAVRDLGSTNGTLLDGCPVESELPLIDGAVLDVGGCLLRYRSRP